MCEPDGRVAHPVDHGGQDLLAAAQGPGGGTAARVAVDLTAEVGGLVHVGLRPLAAIEEVQQDGVAGVAAGLEEGPLGEGILVDEVPHRVRDALGLAEGLPGPGA